MFDSPRPVSCKFWDCGDEDGDCVERVMKESQDAGDKDMTANIADYMRGVAAPKECSPTTALTSLKACVDKNSNGCRGYLNSDKQACNYQSCLADCPKKRLIVAGVQLSMIVPRPAANAISLRCLRASTRHLWAPVRSAGGSFPPSRHASHASTRGPGCALSLFLSLFCFAIRSILL